MPLVVISCQMKQQMPRCCCRFNNSILRSTLVGSLWSFWKTKNRHTISGFVKGEQSEDPRRVCHTANPDVAPFTSLLVNVDHRHTLVTHPRTVSLPPSPVYNSFFFFFWICCRALDDDDCNQCSRLIDHQAICARTMMEMTTTSRATERWWMARSAHLTADGPPVTAARVTRRFLLYTQSARRLTIFSFLAVVLNVYCIARNLCDSHTSTVLERGKRKLWNPSLCFDFGPPLQSKLFEDWCRAQRNNSSNTGHIFIQLVTCCWCLH